MKIEDRWAEFWKQYRAGVWEPDTHALLARTLNPGDLFVDVGAWIGPVTLWALELGARVVAIEPDPVALREFKRLVPSEVELWEGALVEIAGPVRITPCPLHKGHKGGFGDSMTRIAEPIGDYFYDGETVEVPGFTLPDILAGRMPALVKMDIEGYELEVLPSVAPYLAGLGVPLVVSLHTDLPDSAWFAGYRHADMPAAARDRRGRSTSVLAWP